jgi:hypothetical protein
LPAFAATCTRSDLVTTCGMLSPRLRCLTVLLYAAVVVGLARARTSESIVAKRFAKNNARRTIAHAARQTFMITREEDSP